MGFAGPAAPRRVVAIDWSGDRRVETRHDIEKLWLAEVVDGELVRLEPMSRRAAVADVRTMADADAGLMVGMDFSFSFPAWFVDELGVTDGPGVWPLAAGLDPAAFPFFGRAGTRRPPADRCYRRTEAALRASGVPVKSTFQTGGAGAPGTASLTGMAHLQSLRAAGLAVWPFDPFAGDWSRPVIAEIYPRLFIGGAVKSRAGSRVAAWPELAPDAAPRFAELVARSDDAFDAAASALGLCALVSTAEPVERRWASDPAAAIEGWILAPET